jgi:hypothetical protein
MEIEEIGACEAIINKVQTTIDGGARITLDIDPSAHQVIEELFRLKMQNNSLIKVGFAYESNR